MVQTESMKKPGRQSFIPTEADRKLAGKMRHKREALSLTQAELGQRVGLAPATINRYEKLHRGPTAQHLAKIEDVLGRLHGEDDGIDPPGVREKSAPYGRMSDPRSKLPPGLEGFLERFDRRLSDDEKDELRTRGGDFMRPLRKEPDDTFWWALVQLWRRYDPGPDREPSE